jgi:plasmid stability protein
MEDGVNPLNENEGMPSVLVRDIPADLHRRLRVAAAYRGESLSALSLRAVEREVERVEAEMERARRKRESER